MRPGGKTFTITLPWPDSRLSPNYHGKRRAGFSAKKAAKNAAFYECKKAKAPAMVGPLAVRMEFYPPDFRRRDDDNAIGAMKAARDGIALAVKVDDADWKVTYDFKVPEKPGCVVVTLEEA